ncbi:MAG: non-canonical purine NTP pyrophosphatase, partial [Oscillospiraceae bacterium]|nr:non-canonical purine NTP pyrophosphatase [Oscillospiraceae bacterium]
MTFLLATENPGKLREMRSLLADYAVVSPNELGLALDTDETGETFRENALLKACAACAASGLPAIADDSGLCVDALGGAPGVRSRRWGGEGLTDAELCAFLLRRMEACAARGAKFVSHIVCAFPDGTLVEAAGECGGEILREARGDGGFGYDPVFYLPEYG